MLSTILKLFIPVIIRAVTSFIGALADVPPSAEKSKLGQVANTTLGACAGIKKAMQIGSVSVSSLFLLGKLLKVLSNLAAGGSFIGLFSLVSPALDAYGKIKNFISKSTNDSAVVCRRRKRFDTKAFLRIKKKKDYFFFRDSALAALWLDKRVLDFSVKSLIITMRRKIAKMIGGVANKLSTYKIENKKGKAAVDKIISGLRALQRKIDVPEKKPSKFLKILGGVSAGLGGLVFVGKKVAPFLPPPVGAVIASIGGIASMAKTGVDTVEEGVKTAQDINKRIIHA